MGPQRRLENVDQRAVDICKDLGLTPHRFSLEDLIVAVAGDAGCEDIKVARYDFEGGDIYGLCISDGQHIAILARHDFLRPQYEWAVCHELVHVINGDVKRPGGFVHVRRRDPTIQTPEERYTDRLGHALLKLRRVEKEREGLDAFFWSMGRSRDDA
jgi:hypothetical protein